MYDARIPGGETVLVWVGSAETLQRAYPNCFADSAVVAELRRAID